jgi:glycerol-3-phosphate acyltransferase PlsY
VLLLGYALTALLAYLFGSLPTGFLVAKAKGVDIRTVGSKNMGATNVFRVLGKGPGILVLLVDALKGALAVLVLPPLFARLAPQAATVGLPLTAALCAVLGHNYTCWLGFKGGKGVATSAGVLAALVPGAFLVTISVWLVVFALSRYVSLASVCAAGALPVATALLRQPGAFVVLNLVLGLLAIWKHKANIERLRNGTEHRFGKKKAAGESPTQEPRP